MHIPPVPPIILWRSRSPPLPAVTHIYTYIHIYIPALLAACPVP